MPRPDYSGSWSFDRGDATLHPFLAWDGDRLVFEARIERHGATSTNRVRYQLSDADASLAAEECFRSAALNYGNLRVFRREQFPPTRRSPVRAAKRAVVSVEYAQPPPARLCLSGDGRMVLVKPPARTD